MAVLDADTVIAALAALGHDWTPEKITYKQDHAHDTCVLYDPYWTAISVPVPYAQYYAAKTSFRTAADLPSVALTGTAIEDGVVESAIVTGGETIIMTLTNGVWPAAGATFDDIRQDIIDGLNSAQAEAGGWNAKVRDVMEVTTVARTSATVVTITLPATADYSVTADETITATIPANVVTADGTVYPRAFDADATFDITQGS